LLNSPNCNKPNCSGKLFTVKWAMNSKKDKDKCTSCKTLPYAMLLHAIQQILLRPGKWDDFQHWRGPGDEPGSVPPTTMEGWFKSCGVQVPMQDIHDGWAWRAVEAGLEQRKDGKWGM
jgi:hypothetical protein